MFQNYHWGSGNCFETKVPQKDWGHTGCSGGKAKRLEGENGKQKKCGHCKWIEKHSPRSRVLGILKPIYEEVLLNDFKPYETTDKTKKIEKEYQK